VFSQKYKDTQLRLSISETRGTDEERRWVNLTKTDGQKIDPTMFRIYPNPSGSRYITSIMVDVRQNPYRHDGSLEGQK
jgi:hypothetical protein